MSYLSKKEQKRVSRLIGKKLAEMGVKDEITYVGTGKIRKFMRKDGKGGVIMEKNEEGKMVPKMFDVEMQQALNVFRRTLKEIRNSSPEVINAFLGLEVGKAS